MQGYSSYPKSGVHQKILRTKDGRLVRVHFVISEINGQLNGRIISVESVESLENFVSAEAVSIPINQLCLPATIAENKAIPETLRKIATTSHVSPFSIFEFFMSQPTRAPSLVF